MVSGRIAAGPPASYRMAGLAVSMMVTVRELAVVVVPVAIATLTVGRSQEYTGAPQAPEVLSFPGGNMALAARDFEMATHQRVG